MKQHDKEVKLQSFREEEDETGEEESEDKEEGEIEEEEPIADEQKVDLK